MAQLNPSIIFFDEESREDAYQQLTGPYPYKLHCFEVECMMEKQGSSFLIYIQEGKANLYTEHYHFNPIHISKGMYLSCANEFHIEGHNVKGICIEVLNGRQRQQPYKAMHLIGGPIEETGRLKYIDGCTDSLLIPPIKKGDPCLNHLHFPPRIMQTMHTHPTDRVGIVTKGEGRCLTPFGNFPLKEGQVFIIRHDDGKKSIGDAKRMHPNGSHCFQTFSKTMDVIAFHPDSDFGAEDQNHPMINRTIVKGVSASKIEDIQTK